MSETAFYNPYHSVRLSRIVGEARRAGCLLTGKARDFGDRTELSGTTINRKPFVVSIDRHDPEKASREFAAGWKAAENPVAAGSATAPVLVVVSSQPQQRQRHFVRPERETQMAASMHVPA